MSKGPTFCNQLLNLILRGEAVPGIAIAAFGATTLYIALHTGDPGDDQASNEATYVGYVRVAVVRSSLGWTSALNQMSALQNSLDFPAAGGAPNESLTFASIGIAASGSSQVLYSGPLTPPLAINAAGITPRLTTGSTVVEA